MPTLSFLNVPCLDRIPLSAVLTTERKSPFRFTAFGERCGHIACEVEKPVKTEKRNALVELLSTNFSPQLHFEALTTLDQADRSHFWVVVSCVPITLVTTQFLTCRPCCSAEFWPGPLDHWTTSNFQLPRICKFYQVLSSSMTHGPSSKASLFVDVL